MLALSLVSHDVKEVLVAAVGGSPRGLALVDSRPRGLPATSFVRQLRLHLQGARIVSVAEPVAGTVRIEAVRPGRDDGSREETRATVALEISEGNVVLLGAEDRILGALHPARLRERDLGTGKTYTPPGPARGGTHALGDSLDALRAAGSTLLASREREAVERARSALHRALERGEKKLRKRLDAIAHDVSRAEMAPHLRRHGNLLLSNLQSIPRGAREARVTDWEADPPAEVVVEIDPARGARDHAEALFRRARKLETGAKLAADRLATTRAELGALESLRRALADLEPEPGALIDLASRARDAGVAGARETVAALAGEAPRSRAQREERIPYRKFFSGDRPILVGRGAADNDALTLHVARPHDLWLHARGITGAHVVVPLRRDESCPADLLVDAATLAAHFSDARREPIVDVSYSPRRHVRKPRGSAPGAVVVHQESVIALRLEPARLTRLLATEGKGDGP